MKRWIGRLALRLGSWRSDGLPPAEPRYVLIAFPHTSNWDFIWVLAFAWSMDVRIQWMGKEEMFRWPFGGLMRWLGGIPVHRRARANQVEQLAARFQEAERLTLVVPAEGTRTLSARLRSSALSHGSRRFGAQNAAACKAPPSQPRSPSP